jgi:hypothetical protein
MSSELSVGGEVGGAQPVNKENKKAPAHKATLIPLGMGILFGGLNRFRIDIFPNLYAVNGYIKSI